MKQQKAYKFRFYPTKEQEQQLSVEFGCARWVWNRALVEMQYSYNNFNVGLSAQYDVSKHITQYKKTENYQWLNQATAGCLVQKLIDLDTAFKNFFSGRAKFPKFKKKHNAQSVRYQLAQRIIINNYRAGEFIKVPKLGELDIRWSQKPEGTPKRLTISKAPTGKYYVSFACEVDIIELPNTNKSVGVDVGIKDVIVTSDDYRSGSPKFTYKNARKLKKEQRRLSKKTKGSNAWHKQRRKVAKVHEHIAACRRDFLNKETTRIVRENDVIFLEDLNVSGMMKNRKLSKAVADVGIFELNRQIKYKAAWYGKKVYVIDRYFPSTKMCSGCGQIHEMKLSDRVMDCDCGLKIDRDLNAAINIRTAGEAGLAGGVIYKHFRQSNVKNVVTVKPEHKIQEASCLEQLAS